MKVKSESEVAQLCPTLSDPMDCSSIHGIFQARVLEWGAIAFSKRETIQCQNLNTVTIKCIWITFYSVALNIYNRKNESD